MDMLQGKTRDIAILFIGLAGGAMSSFGPVAFPTWPVIVWRIGFFLSGAIFVIGLIYLVADLFKESLSPKKIIAAAITGIIVFGVASAMMIFGTHKLTEPAVAGPPPSGVAKAQPLEFDTAPYRVIAASPDNEEEAKAIARSIRSEDPSIKTNVAEPTGCNDKYGVVAGLASSYTEAQNIADKIRKLTGAKGAYASKHENDPDPSFCGHKHKKPDEEAICGDVCLKKLDNIEYSYPNVASSFLRARENCGDDQLCIMDQQLFAISTYSGDWVKNFLPGVGAHRLNLHDDFPNSPNCTVETILHKPGKDSPNKLVFADQNYYQAVPDDAPPIRSSQEGDKVLLCAVWSCKHLLFDKEVYVSTNLRTKDTWILPNTTESCYARGLLGAPH
jgi:SPOR domain